MSKMNIGKHNKWRKSFPYYKVQWWDNYVSAWHDIQKSFRTKQAADLYGLSLGKKYRIMKISRDKREVT